MAKTKRAIRILIPIAAAAAAMRGESIAQAVPLAPAEPACTWEADSTHSTCKFKEALAGTPTSVVGHTVIVYRASKTGGEGSTRTYLDNSVKRLAAVYGFTATITEDPSIFASGKLADAKVVIMSNGDGDVVPAGAARNALEDFERAKGWGVIWIHAACSFITNGWPFGRESCLQLYHQHLPSGTQRRMFIDSGTAASPNHGIRNPRTEFLLRDLPGWGGKRALALGDQWFCFQAPVRDSAGVSVLFGLDHGSGLADPQCAGGTDPSETGSQLHNLSWTHKMGNGITIYHSPGHDDEVYTGYGNMGDSLLWRYIRYAAKDWCVSGSGDPGCDGATAVRASAALPAMRSPRGDGGLSLPLSETGRITVSLADVSGRPAFSGSMQGPGEMRVPALPPGLYLLRVRGQAGSRTGRIMIY